MSKKIKDKKPLRIVGMPVDRGGCGWYRVRQPLQMISAFTDADTWMVENEETTGDEILYGLKNAQIVLIRQGQESAITFLKSIPELKHLKFVIDIDDNVELIDPLSEHYKEYGMYPHNYQYWKEVGMPHERLWEDGVNGFDHTRNRARILNFLLGLREADMVTVTTERLAEYARQYNKNVAVLPNYINFEKWWPIDVEDKFGKWQEYDGKEEQLRVGWSGGMSHYKDWATIQKPLNKLLRKYQFKLVVVGSHFDGLIDKDLRHLVEIHPWEAFEAHSYRMMCLGLDIAIIPLADMEFNYYKSPIKLAEMSAMGIPSVVAGVPPYHDVYTDGLTALGYDNKDELFEDKLELMLVNLKTRDGIGSNAYQWVKDNYDASKNAQLWVDAFRSIL